MTLLAVIFCFVIPVEAFELGGRVYWWFTSVEGEIEVGSGSLEGTKVDVEDDLGFSNEDFPVVEIFVRSGKHQLSFSYCNIDSIGDNILTRNIVFNGETFNVGAHIRTTLDLDLYDFRYQYDFIEYDGFLDGLSLGLVGRVAVLDGGAGVASKITSTYEDFTQPIPYGGINIDLDVFDDLLEARLLTTVGYYNGPWLDSQAEIALTPLPYLYITGGYRIIYFDIDFDDLELDRFRFAGPYIGLTLTY